MSAEGHPIFELRHVRRTAGSDHVLGAAHVRSRGTRASDVSRPFSPRVRTYGLDDCFASQRRQIVDFYVIYGVSVSYGIFSGWYGTWIRARKHTWETGNSLTPFL